jgi:hypothetical protein
MAILLDTGYFYCPACRRADLTKQDFYQDRSKKYGLSRFCKQCESERTRQAKHQHYIKSEKYKQAQARRSKRAYYLRNRREIMRKSTEYKRRNPGRVRAYLLKRKYKLTPEERTAMIEEQGGCCEICGEYQGDKLEIDHNHQTGRVRAMLCHNCNTGLGMFGDSYELLSIACSYLYHYDEMGD